MENLGIITSEFWKNKRVFITGHTGFKGSWMSMWLKMKGAIVYGYALEPDTTPSLYNICKLDEVIDHSTVGDICDANLLKESMSVANPDIVIHMAAQPLVRKSYRNPVETYQTNVMGTVNVLEAVRECKNVKALLNVTTDKCYENKEWLWGYRENEALGGYDPYSSSKACSELVTAAYRSSFFSEEKSSLAIATARAGNVIGGGDWAEDRLVPDIIRSIIAQQVIEIRNPHAVRPWQHVLEPIGGYLLLCQRLYERGQEFASAWNFGPYDIDVKPVKSIVESLVEKWGNSSIEINVQHDNALHEASLLKLDCSKAINKLNWSPRWGISTALDRIVEWFQAYVENKNMKDVCYQQIVEYESQ